MAGKEEIHEKMDLLIKRNMSIIRAKLLVISNKGGVGKSTVAVNLAACLNGRGAKVGLLDADIHGPSIARMLGFDGERLKTGENGIIPFEPRPGLAAISMASVLENADSPVIWRGPMKMTVLKQFLAEVDWGMRDYLIVDSPPGTGDEPLSICQLIPEMTGAIVVTTPQEIALLDSRKCVNFLRELKIPVLGIIENMGTLRCPECGKEVTLFPAGGGERAAKDMGCPFLGRLPFDPGVVKVTDEGRTFIDGCPDSRVTETFMGICASIDKKIMGERG